VLIFSIELLIFLKNSISIFVSSCPHFSIACLIIFEDIFCDIYRGNVYYVLYFLGAIFFHFCIILLFFVNLFWS